MPAEPATQLSELVADDSTLPRFAVPADLRTWAISARLAERKPGHVAAMLLETATLYAAFVVAGEAISRWWGWTLAWVGLVMCMMRVDAVHHEAVHRSLFRRRWPNDIVAAVSGAMEAFHAPTYRCFHLGHHALTRNDGNPHDPEAFYDETLTSPHRLGPIRVTARTALVGGILIGGVTFVVQLTVHAITTMVGRPPDFVGAASLGRHVRRWGWVPFVLWGGTTAAAVLTGHTGELLRWWVVPLLLFLCGPYTFFALPEHYDAGHNQPMITSTGSVTSNRLYRWITLGGNYHLAHHVFPTASWWRLAEAEERIGENPLRRHGYIAFYRLLWRDLGSVERLAVRGR